MNPEALLDAAGPALGGGDFTAFAAVGPALAAAARPAWLAERCAAQLRAHRGRPFEAMPEADAERWFLARRGGVTLSVELLPRVPRERHLNGTATHRLLVGLVGAPRLQLWRHPRAGDPTHFDPENALECLGERVLAPGEWLALEAWRDLRVAVPGRAVLLVVEGPPLYPVAWSYHRDGRPAVLAAADPQFAQLDHALRVLLLLGHPGGAALSASLAQHPFHALRWTAIRAAFGFDEATGRALLREALTDPHPEVRSAATRALAALEAAWPAP